MALSRGREEGSVARELALAIPDGRPFPSNLEDTAHLRMQWVHVCTLTHHAQTLTPCHSHALTFLKNNPEKKCCIHVMSTIVSRSGEEAGSPLMTKVVACAEPRLQFPCVCVRSFDSVFQM